MNFGTAPKGGSKVRVGTDVEYDKKERRWVSTPIHIYTNRQALEVKGKW